jgi:hypothetical protein
MHWMCRNATYWLCRTASGFDAIVPGVRCKRCHGRERIHCRKIDAEQERVDEPRIHIISVTVPFNFLYNKIKIEIERENTHPASLAILCLALTYASVEKLKQLALRTVYTAPYGCLGYTPAARPRRGTPMHPAQGQATRSA